MFRKLWKIFFCWRFEVATEGRLRSASLIVTQAYSRKKDGCPGQGNEILSREASRLCRRYHLSVYPQEPVAMALNLHDNDDVTIAGIVIEASLGPHLCDRNTFSVAAVQAAYCKENGIRTIIVVAHPWHMNRALWTYKKLGLDPIPAPVLQTVTAYQDPELVHWSCRTPKRVWAYLLREIVSRLLFLKKGWI